jgi:hypothetical protein
MRLAAFILSILVLALGCMPCADANAFPSKARQEISTVTEQGTEHNDICSPFCICTCCAGFSVSHTFIEIKTFIPQQRTDHGAYYIASLRKVALPIWQPPQLV